MIHRRISSREREVLEQISRGFTTQEIATNLFLSPHTIINYRKNLLEKMEVPNSAGLVRRAVELNLLLV